MVGKAIWYGTFAIGNTKCL